MTSSIDSAPQEICTEIFFFLGLVSLSKYAIASKGWVQVSEDEKPWKPIVKKLSTDQTLKQLFAARCSKPLSSTKELLSRVQTFIQRLPLEKNGSFESLNFTPWRISS